MWQCVASSAVNSQCQSKKQMQNEVSLSHDHHNISADDKRPCVSRPFAFVTDIQQKNFALCTHNNKYKRNSKNASDAKEDESGYCVVFMQMRRLFI